MHDAFVGGWAQGSHLSIGTRGSLRDLNHQFLDLAATRTEWPAGRVASLSAAQREAVAACPYALFDLRFEDDGHWLVRLQNSSSWQVADESAVDDSTSRFVRLALFYAWHVASSAGFNAQLLLGMNGDTAAAFRRMSVNRLPALVLTEAKHLSARWSGCGAFWTALTAAASGVDAGALRRVQLHGLQLAAAARLPDP